MLFYINEFINFACLEIKLNKNVMIQYEEYS